MLTIRYYRSSDHEIWDNYVRNHPNGTLYHLSGWENVIEETYGHKSYYLMALANSNNPSNPTNHNNRIVGILPLIHMKHFLFGNKLVSMPFFDMGGILADNETAEKALLMEAIRLALKLGVGIVEFRHTNPLNWLTSSLQQSNSLAGEKPANQLPGISCATSSHKVRLLLELPDSSEALMKSFKSKLRSQVKKPMKEGLKAVIGGEDLVEDFYYVFSINMRDLGSPVHAKKLMKNVIQQFPDEARIIVVYKNREPMACSIVIGFKDVLENLWASALRKYSRLAPNMLLYWTMLEYACNKGCRYFDFGRSSPGEGTYKFKQQWGAHPNPLYWQYVSLDEGKVAVPGSEKSRFDRAIYYWKKLPVPLTKLIGPMIRRHIRL